MSFIQNIQIIEKEQIQFLKFPKEDVLKAAEEKQNRSVDLGRALYLGNLEQEKVRITFQDDSGLKRVETTIWGVTDKSVILKRSSIIPFNACLLSFLSFDNACARS